MPRDPARCRAGRLWDRATQLDRHIEVAIAAGVLNRMLEFGRPKYVCVA